jgi:tRNA (cmo5U34)-methyltransferase
MEHIRDAFNPIAAQYDAQRKYIIPEMKQYYGAAVWAADVQGPAPAILDIGAGTGLLSAMILQKFPGAQMTLMDIAANMLDVAKERFKGREDMRYVVSDYSVSDLGGPYDLVCSALSIHHLTPEDKRRLFVRIFTALRPCGMFVNADQADGETPYFRERYMEYWNDFLKNGPLNTEENREIFRRRETLDRNERLSVQLAWLRDAGFSDVDVVYRNRTFIVTVARKG